MSTTLTVFPCNTCSLTFQTSREQRAHMKSDQHVNSLRKRLAGLQKESPLNQAQNLETPVGNAKEYATQLPLPVKHDYNANKKMTMPASNVRSGPNHCLFCTLESSDPAASLEHMISVHSFYLPMIDQLFDLDTFLSYLVLVVFDCNECLFCGLQKNSTEAVQTHMRDKGHCMLDLDSDSELLEFWEASDEEEEPDRTIRISDTELRLTSGAIVDSRSGSRHTRLRPAVVQARLRSSQQRRKCSRLQALMPAREDNAASDSGSRLSVNRDQRMAIRSEMGLVGISDQQRRALQTTEHKIKQREAVAKAARCHAMEQQPVKVMYYKTENPIYQAG